jgi:outer membrane immunogenic protein
MQSGNAAGRQIAKSERGLPMKIMKGGLLATAAFGALSVGSAAAADMRAPVMKALPPPPPACAQFGGFYLGGQVGSTTYNHRWVDLDGLGGFIDHRFATSTDTSNWSWNAGVLAGYNWQSRCTVFGIEADWNWTNAKAEKHLGIGGEDSFVNVASRMKWFGTLRARTGLVVDNLLLYVTGGVAWARSDREFSFFFEGKGGPSLDVFSSSNTRWGWTAGVGAEWAITANVSLKSELLYMDFVNKETSFASLFVNPGVTYRFDNRDSVWVGRVGLNFRWGGGPVVANY